MGRAGEEEGVWLWQRAVSGWQVVGGALGCLRVAQVLLTELVSVNQLRFFIIY